MKLFNKKVIISGRHIEVYEYEQAVGKGYVCKRSGRASKATAENATINRGKVAQRARTRISRVINANPCLNKFITLTFADNVQDIAVAQKAFKEFIQRLKRFHSGVNLLYVSVVEFQKRGAIHFHLLSNMPYTPAVKLATLWRNGMVSINAIDNVDNVGLYVSKYITKDNIDDRLCGKKCYTMSKGLQQPIVVDDDSEVEYILENVENVEYSYGCMYDTEHNGVCTYTAIRLTKPFPYRNSNQRFMERWGCTRFDDKYVENPFLHEKWLKIFSKKEN